MLTIIPIHNCTLNTEGTDYVFSRTQQLTITESSIRECISLLIIDDSISEGSELLQAYLSLVSIVNNSTISNDSINVILTVDQTNITIVDNIGKEERV